MKEIDERALAIAFGAVWASYVTQLAWIAKFGWGEDLVDALSSLYVGYKPGLRGSIAGAAWGFLDGALAGATVAMIYNAFATREEERIDADLGVSVPIEE